MPLTQGAHGVFGHLAPRAFADRRLLLPARLSEVAAPALHFLASAVATGPVVPPSAWQHILITGSNHLGDVLMRTGSLPALRTCFPSARIAYLTSPLGAEALRGNPWVDQVLPWHETDSPLRIPTRAMVALRAERFDAVIVHNYNRYWPYLLLATRLRIPNRAGFVAKGFSGLVTHPVRLPFPDRVPAYFADLVAELGDVPRDWSLRPQLFLSDDDLAEAESYLDRHPELRDRPFLVAACTMRQAAATWPAESWSRLIELLEREQRFSVVLTGTRDDRAALERVASLTDNRALVSAGAFSPRGLAALMTHAAAVVSLDSGPRHLANAVGVPVVFFRNLATFAEEPGPYCPTERDAVSDPSGRLPMPRQIAVLEAITPEHVLGLVLEALRVRPARADA